MKRLFIISILAACAFICIPAFSEVPGYQHDYGCVGDRNDSKEQDKVSVFVEFESIVFEHLPPTLASDAKANRQNVQADNSVSTAAQPPDEWGRQIA